MVFFRQALTQVPFAALRAAGRRSRSRTCWAARGYVGCRCDALTTITEQPVMEHRASTALVVGYPHEDVGKFESLPGAVDEAEAIGAC